MDTSRSGAAALQPRSHRGASAGFWRSYLLRGLVEAPFFPVHLSPLVHVHAALFLGWVLLFIVQSALVSAGRRDLHRTLGIVATAWIPLLVAVGFWTAAMCIVHHTDPGFMDPRRWFAVQLSDLARAGRARAAAVPLSGIVQASTRSLRSVCIVTVNLDDSPGPTSARVDHAAMSEERFATFGQLGR